MLSVEEQADLDEWHRMFREPMVLTGYRRAAGSELLVAASKLPVHAVADSAVRLVRDALLSATGAGIVDGESALAVAEVEAARFREVLAGILLRVVRASGQVQAARLRVAEHNYSSTQVDLPTDLAEDVMAYGRSIPDADLAENGREAEPHVTVKYGIHTSSAGEVREVLEKTGQVTVTLGETACFEGDEYDVLYVAVDSPDLVRLNALISEMLPVTDTHPVYVPHVCVAYLKAGLGKQYVGDQRFVGRSFASSEVRFSPVSGRDARIETLGGPGSGNFGHAGRPGEVGGSVPAGEGGAEENDDRETLRLYTQTGGTYREVNEGLREGRDMSAHQTVAAIDRAFAEHGEPAPAVIYRGIAGYEPEELNLEDGMTFTDKGFVSTATVRSDAVKFATRGQGKLSGEAVGIVFKINTGGAIALDMSRYSRYGESELLLNRGTTFRVTSIQEGYPGEKLAVVTMSVVRDAHRAG